MPTQKLGVSAAEMRQMIAKLKAHLALGKSDADIAEEMELDGDDFRRLKNEMYRREKAELQGKSTEEFYIEYRFRQEGVIAELDRMVNFYAPQKIEVSESGGKMMVDEYHANRYGGQPSAIVGALKAKSDIIDRIVKVGQEFGILEKAPEKKLIVGGIAVANMPTEDLRKTIVGAVTDLKKLMGRYGDTDVLGRPLPALAAPAAPVIQDAELVPAAGPPPKFSGKGKPKMAAGGKSKAAGARAANRKKATSSPVEG